MIFNRKGKKDQKDENTIFVTIDENKISVPSDIAQKSELKADKTEIVVRKIIDGKLYDTSKATKICATTVPGNEIPNELCSAGLLQLMFGCDVNLYKGNNTYFCTISGEVFAVSEEWVMKWLGRCDTDKYIELFGEPELA